MPAKLIIPDLLPTCEKALYTVRGLLDVIKERLSSKVMVDGKVDAAALEQHQFAAHGYAWYCTYEAALTQMLAWGQRLEEQGNFTELEQLLVQAAFSEYLHQIFAACP